MFEASLTLLLLVLLTLEAGLVALGLAVWLSPR